MPRPPPIYCLWTKFGGCCIWWGSGRECNGSLSVFIRFNLYCDFWFWIYSNIKICTCILKNGPRFPMFICGVSIPNQMKYQINVLNLSIYFFLHLVTSESIYERQCSTLHILLKGYTYIYTYINKNEQKRKTWKISVKLKRFHCILRSFK